MVPAVESFGPCPTVGPAGRGQIHPGSHTPRETHNWEQKAMATIQDFLPTHALKKFDLI